MKPPYELIHPVHPIDCFDYEACGINYYADDEDDIQDMKAFVLDADKCQDFPPLFRIHKMSDHLVVHRELANELDVAGFTGIGWIEPSAIGGGGSLVPFRR